MQEQIEEIIWECYPDASAAIARIRRELVNADVVRVDFTVLRIYRDSRRRVQANATVYCGGATPIVHVACKRDLAE